MNRSERRAYKQPSFERPHWNPVGKTVGGRLRCPECGVVGVVWLTVDEMIEHMRTEGRAVDVRQMEMEDAIKTGPWWWCHACTSGGVMRG